MLECFMASRCSAVFGSGYGSLNWPLIIVSTQRDTTALKWRGSVIFLNRVESPFGQKPPPPRGRRPSVQGSNPRKITFSDDIRGREEISIDKKKHLLSSQPFWGVLARLLFCSYCVSTSLEWEMENGKLDVE